MIINFPEIGAILILIIILYAESQIIRTAIKTNSYSISGLNIFNSYVLKKSILKLTQKNQKLKTCRFISISIIATLLLVNTNSYGWLLLVPILEISSNYDENSFIPIVNCLITFLLINIYNVVPLYLLIFHLLLIFSKIIYKKEKITLIGFSAHTLFFLQVLMVIYGSASQIKFILLLITVLFPISLICLNLVRDMAPSVLRKKKETFMWIVFIFIIGVEVMQL